MISEGLREAQNRICVLIKLKDSCSLGVADQLKLAVRKINGRILLHIEEGRACVAVINPVHKAMLASLSYVEVVGSVDFAPREIRRIRVQEPMQGESKTRYVVRKNQIVRIDRSIDNLG